MNSKPLQKWHSVRSLTIYFTATDVPPFIRPLLLGKNPFAEPEILPVCLAKELFYENSLYSV